MSRARWHLWTSGVVLAWLVAAVAVATVYRSAPAQPWLLLHLLLLGAATNAIIIWSSHFSAALLRLPGSSDRRAEGSRLLLLNLAIVAVFVCMLGSKQTYVVIPATVIFVMILVHIVGLLRRMRRALPSRFGATLRYYVAAGLWLLVGVTIASLMSHGAFSAEQYQGLVLAHACVNLFGWIGLSICGTLVTLWPTMLHTQVAERAEWSARTALPILNIALFAVATGAVFDQRVAVVLGVAAYLAGLVILSRPMLKEARRRAPNSFATWSVLAGWLWLLVSLSAFLGILAITPEWSVIAERAGRLVAALAAGFVTQVLLGAMSYLLPVVIGGGPTAVRWRNRVVDRAAIARVVTANAALVVLVLPIPVAVRITVSLVALLALASALPLMIQAMLKPPVEHRHGSNAQRVGDHTLNSAPSRTGAAAVGACIVVLAVAAAVAFNPAAIDVSPASNSGAGAQIGPTGQTTSVEVVMTGMRFSPSTISVPLGNSLMINVTNRDSDPHDLVLESGQRTPLLSEGQSAQLDVPIIDRSLDGWCSVPGHRQMGMTLQIDAGDTSSGPTVSADSNDMSHMDHMSPGTAGESAVKDLDLMRNPGPDFQARDAMLPPTGRSRVHRVTLVVKQTEQEVAPGVRQTLWTYGGTAPGPTLHGKIGDKFKITLVNDGDIGHSIDFHAGALAPDGPMRTIGPGEKLRYNFTATRAGIWLYHCSTMPMSLHIANGMFGAVVIDPPHLAPVDKQFVIVQSEFYLGPQGGTASMASISADQPDLVVFNGYPNQYKYQPLAVAPGERVRMWVVSAGPNRGSAFHVVGGQFDTVYQEGRYVLRSGAGGSQVLGLAPAQGGFVEFSLREPGNYPFVSHSMVDAERGAAGILHVAK